MAVNGTPTFFVGQRLPDNSVRVTERFSGAQSFDIFVKAIAAALAAPTQ